MEAFQNNLGSGATTHQGRSTTEQTTSKYQAAAALLGHLSNNTNPKNAEATGGYQSLNKKRVLRQAINQTVSDGVTVGGSGA